MTYLENIGRPGSARNKTNHKVPLKETFYKSYILDASEFWAGDSEKSPPIGIRSITTFTTAAKQPRVYAPIHSESAA